MSLLTMPRNTFRDALRAGQTQIGLWVGLADANAAEALAAAKTSTTPKGPVQGPVF